MMEKAISRNQYSLRKKSTGLLARLLLSLLLLTAWLPRAQGAEEVKELEATATAERISKHGNVHLSITAADFREAGYEGGDMVTISFLDQSLDLPYVSNYSDVDSGQPGLFAVPDNEFVSLAINMGDFATTYGLAVKTTFADKSFEWKLREGLEESVSFRIRLKEKAGYLTEYTLRHLDYTNERADYPRLTDEAFANFRQVQGGSLGANTLFRSASPIDNSRGRADFADAAYRAHGISVVVNLADTEAEMQKLEGFQDRYYAGTKVIGLNAGMDFTAEDYREKLKMGLVFMAENPGIYGLHCLEGKDRSGFVAAVLASFMGASFEEVLEDYMLSFENYYGLEKGSEQYAIIAESNVVGNLKRAFGLEDIEKADLAAAARTYLEGLGLSPEQLEALAENLSRDHAAEAGEKAESETAEKESSLIPEMGDEGLLLLWIFLLGASGACFRGVRGISGEKNRRKSP